MAGVTDQFGPTLQQLLDLAHAALIAADRPVGLVHLAPGATVAWDDCCEGDEGGQLWVRLIEVYPSRSFPTPDTAQQCGITTLAMRVGVGVVRCAHVLTDEGTPPSADDMTGDTLGITADATALLKAIECGLPSGGIPIAKVVRWTPQGPSGGCAGGEWEMTVGVDWCGC